ncbi:Beta-lactamase hydrolase-like protein (plasmid) [Pseudoseohaeicola sp. NH-UV-7]|uniref:MBL fold metallo-hydrolase n=1 Tax=unclassified Sulfitobacter TaxID=196795 RepID=UPI000E09E8A0|nr:MBL fold metallo-hydrolase [Sulfitobacter sp. JL08]AXI53576.1 MBL fold metallo-hydrolase [Sulfitobacter sp. JL08]
MTNLNEPVVRHSPSTGKGSPDVWGIYEPDTGSIQYICACPTTKAAALIDVVWNFDPVSFATDTGSMDQVVALAEENGLNISCILDTHPHADHLMASNHLKKRLNVPNAIGAKVREIADLWRKIYNMPDAFDPQGDFDRLFEDGETFAVGELDLRVMLSPGHTLGSVTYICGDAAFVHDTLMMPDSGTSRCDFPGGSADELWTTIQTILNLPEKTRLFVGHDYGAEGRDEPAWEASVADHKAHNKHVKDGTSKSEYIKARETRDAKLALPERMLAALQINLRAGQLPDAESDGHSYLKIPVDKF